jgi:ABC-type branched-subunit amino acid transport system ATPase component
MTSLLQLSQVRAGYGVGPDILDTVTLNIEEGRSYCIIGPNGAGKSTLLKVICGILAPRDGEVLFRGAPVGGMRPDELLRIGICYVPQERTVFPAMTVRENLMMGAYSITDRNMIQTRMQRVIEMFPILGERWAQLGGTLSGGEQQMVTLGRALMVNPTLMMIDEPSLGLAPQVADQIFATIQGLGDLGITVLLVEQNAHKGLRCADWGIVLDLGTNRFEGPANGILEDPRIRELYLGTTVAATKESDR